MMTGSDLLGLQDWQAVADILALPVVALSLWIGLTQIRKQIEISSKESSLDAVLRFSEIAHQNETLRSSLEERYLNRDDSLREDSIWSYYRKYWDLQGIRWEFYRAGLIPSEVFFEWAIDAQSHALGYREFNCFNSRGEIVQIGSTEPFEEFISKVGTEKREFFIGLTAIPRHQDGDKQKIMRYVLNMGRKYRSRPSWKLS